MSPHGDFESRRGASREVGATSGLEFVPLARFGSRYEFTTSQGKRLGVVIDEDGRRSLLVGKPGDPDAAQTLALDEEDRLALVSLLGGVASGGTSSGVLSSLASLQHRVEGLVVCSVPLREGAPLANRSLGEALGQEPEVSVVAVQEGHRSEAATAQSRPSPGDVLVVVGTARGIVELLRLCDPSVQAGPGTRGER